MCHSEAVMENSCWLHICVFQEISGTCRKKKKRNFNHRLGACYNLGIYIYMLKVFLLLFVLPPHSCSVLWNNSALMRRFAW